MKIGPWFVQPQIIFYVKTYPKNLAEKSSSTFLFSLFLTFVACFDWRVPDEEVINMNVKKVKKKVEDLFSAMFFWVLGILIILKYSYKNTVVGRSPVSHFVFCTYIHIFT